MNINSVGSYQGSGGYVRFDPKNPKNEQEKKYAQEFNANKYSTNFIGNEFKHCDNSMLDLDSRAGEVRFKDKMSEAGEWTGTASFDRTNGRLTHMDMSENVVYTEHTLIVSYKYDKPQENGPATYEHSRRIGDKILGHEKFVEQPDGKVDMTI